MSKYKQSLGFITAASGIGMFIEVYDFLIFAYLASVLGQVLFPPTPTPIVATLQALLVFAVGFLMRPVGSLLFGHIGDKFGRKISFTITLLLMGLSSLGIGLLPPYSQIGLIATVLLVLFRLLQGLSLGGEFGAAATYIIEFAPSNRRNLFGSLIQMAWPLGLLAAVITLYINTAIIGTEGLFAYGWRYPFYVAAIIVVVGVIMRYLLEETPIYKSYAYKKEVLDSPIIGAFKKAWKQILIILIIQIGQAAVWYSAYITTFTTFWLNVAKIPYLTTLYAFMIIYFLTSFLYPLSGLLGDRYGRRHLFRWPLTLAAITIIPLYSIFTLTSNILILGIVTFIPLIYAATTNAALSAVYPELVPANVRFTSFNFAYQTATAIFGGFIPYISTAILYFTGSIVLSVSYVVVVAAIAAIVSWIWLPETKGVDLGKTIK
jgi:MHS family proline/betaine transporter-like MFS transporter